MCACDFEMQSFLQILFHTCIEMATFQCECKNDFVNHQVLETIVDTVNIYEAFLENESFDDSKDLNLLWSVFHILYVYIEMVFHLKWIL